MSFLTFAEGAIIKITSALVSLFLGIVIAKLAGKITKHLLAQAEINRLLKQSGIKAIDQRVGNIVEYTIYAITVIFILQQLGLTRLILTVLTIAAVLSIGLAFAISFRNFVPNAIQGLVIKRKLRKYVGKEVKIGPITGTLTKVGMIQSMIQNHEKHYIPHIYTKQNFKPLQAD